MPELVFVRRGQELLRVSLERGRLVLGRSEPSDIALPDPDVSRLHVALLYDGTRCLLEDLSGQGTLVDGKRVKHCELHEGACLSLGQWSAVFQERSSAPEPSSDLGSRTAVKPARTVEDGLAPAQLRVRQGTTESIHPLPQPVFTVGKDAGNTVVIEDEFISNRHLKVTRKPEGFHMVDLNSTNGTFHGAMRLYEVDLPLHTVLQVGEAELLFEPVAQAHGEPAPHGMVGQDAALRRLVERIKRVAPSDDIVAVLGESGTGKELVARALHNCSPRAGKPFIPINCAAISRQLMESELFGHEKGAFTGAASRRKGAFEEAHGGTLFLDEIGELPLELQPKLLRVLEDGELTPVGTSKPRRVDVRVVVATHRDLKAWMLQGLFREDLYYRLCGLRLLVPPLRQRRGDIRLLAEHFVRQHTPRGQTVKLTAAALERLEQHSWPGNIRELRNVMKSAMLLRERATLDASDIAFEPPLREEPPAPAGPAEPELPEGMTLEQRMEQLKRQLVHSTLRRYGFDKDRAAQHLGLSRATLYRWLQEWELDREKPSE